MEELFYETWREKNGITIMGYQLNRKQLFEMMRDFRLQIEQSHKPVVVRGGAIEAKSFPLEGEALKWTNSSVTQITPTEPLATEVRDTVASRGHIHKWHKTLDGETICYMCGETQIE